MSYTKRIVFLGFHCSSKDFLNSWSFFVMICSTFDITKQKNEESVENKMTPEFVNDKGTLMATIDTALLPFDHDDGV